MKGARALWLLSRFSKVTRRKGETASRHTKNNGYTPKHQATLKNRQRPQPLGIQNLNLTVLQIQNPLPLQFLEQLIGGLA